MFVDINLPDIGDGSLEITEIMVNIGDKVQVEQSLITVEGEKTSIEIPSPIAGVVKKINIAVSDKVSTGSLIMVFESLPAIVDNLSSHYKSVKMENTINLNLKEDKKNYIYATPLIRHIARELEIDLNKIKGTGRKGRIIRKDIQSYINQAISISENLVNNNVNNLLKIKSWPKINFNKFGKIEEKKLRRTQKIIGDKLYRNWIMIPHVTQFDEIDITDIEKFRKEQNTEAKKKNLDLKLTILVFVVKAVAKALEELPYFNSSLSENKQNLILKKYINIGIAVDTNHGLVVPILRNVNKKSIINLSRELIFLSENARSNKLIDLDMQGGCFTISNLGNIGGTAFTPIINAPEIAILGISKSSIKPIWNGKDFIPRLMLPLSLSYNHHIINGADGVRFINFISSLMSDIRRLLI